MSCASVVSKTNLALWVAVSALAVLFLAGACHAQEVAKPQPDLGFQKGPGTGELGPIAEVKLLEGYVFTGAKGTQMLMEKMQNPISGQELGFLAPKSMEWFLVFEYDKCGYVKDDEKKSLDAKAMLEAMKLGSAAGNKEREKRGWAAVALVGWETPPHYDEATNNLEWGTRLESEGKQNVNYNIRLLGREGVMAVTFVGSPEDLKANLPTARSLLASFTFKSGQRYAEYRQGDKIAKYGLSALVVGGGAALAAKAGLFKYVGKFAIFIFLGIAAFFKKIVGLFKRSEK